jgi:ribosomal protein S18 acetylase RimI-like enzyme
MVARAWGSGGRWFESSRPVTTAGLVPSYIRALRPWPSWTYAALMDEQPEDVHVEVVVSPEVAAEAATLFDDPIDRPAIDAFLADERHHLLIGYVGGRPAGFATAIELLHPDKPQPEMFLYELGVGSEHRRRGVATALMRRLIQLCHERGCSEMFVLTDEDNAAGMATYRRAGGKPESAGVMFTWDWRREE